MQLSPRGPSGRNGPSHNSPPQSGTPLVQAPEGIILTLQDALPHLRRLLRAHGYDGKVYGKKARILSLQNGPDSLVIEARARHDNLDITIYSANQDSGARCEVSWLVTPGEKRGLPRITELFEEGDRKAALHIVSVLSTCTSVHALTEAATTPAMLYRAKSQQAFRKVALTGAEVRADGATFFEKFFPELHAQLEAAVSARRTQVTYNEKDLTISSMAMDLRKNPFVLKAALELVQERDDFSYSALDITTPPEGWIAFAEMVIPKVEAYLDELRADRRSLTKFAQLSPSIEHIFTLVDEARARHAAVISPDPDLNDATPLNLYLLRALLNDRNCQRIFRIPTLTRMFGHLNEE